MAGRSRLSRCLAPAPRSPVISQGYLAASGPGLLTGRALWAQVIRHARCAESSLDPDEWFPVSAEAGVARQEAAAAIAVCTACPVRVQCLALSLRHWDTGRHGVWGGLVAAGRARLRRRLPAGSGLRRGTAVPRMIVRSSSPRSPGRLVKGGDVQ